jgi:fluoride exporter
VSPALWAGVALLGALGAVGRVVLSALIARRTAGALPVGTLAVNVAGALALGVLVGAEPSDDLRRLLGTGLLGAFTTFSTWMLEARLLFADGRRWRAAALVVGSLVLGLAAFAAGRALASAIA